MSDKKIWLAWACLKGVRPQNAKQIFFFMSGFWFLSSFVNKILFLGPVQWVNLAKKILQEIIFSIFRLFFYLVNVQCDSSFLKPIDTTAVNMVYKKVYEIQIQAFISNFSSLA